MRLQMVGTSPSRTRAVKVLLALAVAISANLLATSAAFAWSGHVIDARTGEPVTGIGSAASSGSYGGFVVSASDGSYGWSDQYPAMTVFMVDMGAAYRPAFYHATPLDTGASVFDNQTGSSSIDLYLDRIGTGAISGRVEDHLGRPVWCAQVRAYREVPNHGVWDAVDVTTITGRRGEFSVSRLDDGVYHLGVARDLSSPVLDWFGGTSVENAADITVKAGEVTGPIAVTLGYAPAAHSLPPAIASPYPETLEYMSVNGQTIDAETGRGVSVPMGCWWFSGGFGSDADGNYSVATYRRANTSTWTSWLSTPDYLPAVWDGQVNLDYVQTFFVGDTPEYGLTLVLNKLKPYTISGTLRWPDGAPVASQRVMVLYYAPKLDIWDPVEVLVTTDAQGAFTVRDLDAGRYRFGLPAPDGNPIGQIAASASGEPAEIEIAPGDHSIGDITIHETAVAVTLARSAAKVSYDGSVTLTGTVAETGAHGRPLDGVTVALEVSGDAATWRPWCTVTSSAGTFSKVLAGIRQKTWIRARFVPAQADDHVAATSNPVNVVSYASLTIPVAPSVMYYAKTYSLYGYLNPAHANVTYPVTVYCERYESGKWVPRRTIKTKAAGNSASGTKYTASLKLPSRGRWRLRAFHEDGGHLATYSAWRYTTVK